MHRIRTRVLLVMLIIAGAGAAAIAGTLPKDPCALLTPTEVQTLDPGGKIGQGKVDASASPIGTQCSYTWGPRTVKWGDNDLTVMVIDVSKGFAGRSPELLEQGIALKAKSAGANGSTISGIGDAAAFIYEERSYNASVETYLKAKDLYLTVTFHHGDGLQSKDKLTALLKTAAGRL